MPIDKFSDFVLKDLDRSNKLTPDIISTIVANRFTEIALSGDIVKDIAIVKEAFDEAVKPKGLLPIRLKNGRLVSPFTLRNLLTVKMQQIAKKNMGRGGRLEYKSGRLIDSAEVEPQILNNNNTVSLQFSYMFGPYEVFDPKADVVTDGGLMKSRLATPRRSPRKLFAEALKEAAEEILFRGYILKVSQVGVTQR